jgi:hypothetical protein
MLDVSSQDGSAQIEGMKKLKTNRGYTVNALGKGKYRILETDEILTADDPSQQ